MKKLTTIIFVLFYLVSCNQKDQQANGTLYFNGDIITMNGEQPEYAEALVQQDGKIVFVGSKAEALKQYSGKVEEIDLGGKTIVPAFLDAHGHFFNVGFSALAANMLPPPDGPNHNFESIIKTLNEYKNSEEGKYATGKLGWIVGNGYDDSQLEEKDHPKASDLDKVSTEVPVMIIHQSGHLASLNNKALEMVGYTKSTKDPEGGVIRRLSDGSPSGVLEEAAFFNILVPVLNKMDAEMAEKCIQLGQEMYASFGYLTAQDGRTTKSQVAALSAAADKSMYYIDVVAYPDVVLGTDYLEQNKYAPAADHSYQNRFRIGGLKLTLDGSPQGKTAWLSQCYHKNPEGQSGCYKGYPIMDDSAAINYVKTAFKLKWQMLCHSNGDEAISQYIKAVDAAIQEYGNNDHRTVLIHGQTLRKDQIPELVRLKVIPSLFPMHTFYWGDWHEQSVLGTDRASYISPTRDVLKAGLILTSHHDAPVTKPNSMRVLDATVNRITRSGKILGPDQRLTPYEGLKALTDWAAYQYYEEKTKGTLSVGKLADLVILDQNPLKIDPLLINKIKIVESIKEGKTVFPKKS